MKSSDYSKNNWFYLDHTFCIRGIVVETSNTYTLLVYQIKMKQYSM